MIISFYPGSGGNKYYRYQQNQEWQTFQKGYDLAVNDQYEGHRYPTKNFVDIHINTDTILTHCLDTALIRSVWPNHKITVIIADVQSSLRREWMLFGHQRYLSRVTDNNSKLELYQAIKDIKWPNIDSEDQLQQLPNNILKELNNEWNKNNFKKPELAPLARLKKHYVDLIDSAIESIYWHKNYYQTYPINLTYADTTINVDQGSDDFAQHMKEELNCYKSDLFDHCWKTAHGQ